MCFNQTYDISTRGGSSLKLVDNFTYLGSSVSSTEKEIDTLQTKVWTAIDRLKSDLTDKMKRSFFRAAVVSILLYGCPSRTLTKRMEKKLDSNYTRMLRAILKKSRGQHLKRQQLNGHLSPLTKTIQVRRTRLAGHYRKSRDELISDVLLWTPSHGRAKAAPPAGTYVQQLCDDAGCSPEDLPEAMNDREEWRERVRDIRAGGMTRWWWWWWWLYKHDLLFSIYSFLVLSLKFAFNGFIVIDEMNSVKLKLNPLKNRYQRKCVIMAFWEISKLVIRTVSNNFYNFIKRNIYQSISPSPSPSPPLCLSVCLSVSLSLYIYIYIYIHTQSVHNC